MIDPEKFLEKFEKLPEKLQDLLSSDKIFKTIQDILGLMKIDLKYLNPIQETVEEILLLEKPKNNFSKILQEKTDLNNNQVQTIEDLIEKQIFSQVEPELNLYSSPMIFLENIPPESISLEEIKKPKIEEEFSPILSPKEVKEELVQEPVKETLEPSLKEKPIALEKEKIKEEYPQEKIEIPKIPEPHPVIVEKPLNRIQGLKKVKLPKVQEEEQQKIKEKLFKIMTEKKTNAPSKIIEEMKKISKNGVRTNKGKEPPPPPKQKYPYFEQKKEPISLITEENKKFIPEEGAQKDTNSEEKMPSILENQIKEFKKKKQ